MCATPQACDEVLEGRIFSCSCPTDQTLQVAGVNGVATNIAPAHPFILAVCEPDDDAETFIISPEITNVPTDGVRSITCSPSGL